MKMARRRNPKVPWDAYERYVRNVLESVSKKVKLQVDGKRTLKDATDAEYEVDAYAELEVFGGAKIKIVVECKRHGKPVERDMVAALHRKTQELGAHKAMLFSTSGFQKGALVYARKHGIALVQLASETTKRKTLAPNYKSMYVGISLSFLVREDELTYSPSIVCILRSALKTREIIGSDNPGPLRDWLLTPLSIGGSEVESGDPAS